jgi:signal transduction histidine kinase
MRFKLWAGMMALIVIVLLLLWFFQVVFLESFYTSMSISNIKNEAASIISVLNKDNKSEYEGSLDAFAFKNNISVELLDNRGETIYLTGTSVMGMGMNGQMPMMRNNVRSELLQEALSGRGTTLPYTHPRFGYKFMMIGIPAKYSTGLTGALIINMPIAPVEDTASILKWQLFYITVILLAASLIISFLISKSFTRPILEIKKATETMASGDFSARITTKRQDEIGKLAVTINYLGEQLSKIERLRKDLIANVSHELRTPLSLIRGYAETIRDVSGEIPEKREYQLGIIIEEAERLSRIVDDILNLSQLQSGYISLNKGHIQINELLANVVKRYDVLSQNSGVKIIQNSSGDAMLEADEERIEQVLYNLINNAFNHTPEGGTITVKTYELSQAVRIEISDTGSGIPAEDIPHIWDRYYKADKSSSNKSIGTGLGLAIVKEVLEAHKALFGVESKKNQGTTFWFELKK